MIPDVLLECLGSDGKLGSRAVVLGGSFPVDSLICNAVISRQFFVNDLTVETAVTMSLQMPEVIEPVAVALLLPVTQQRLGQCHGVHDIGPLRCRIGTRVLKEQGRDQCFVRLELHVPLRQAFALHIFAGLGCRRLQADPVQPKVIAHRKVLPDTRPKLFVGNRAFCKIIFVHDENSLRGGAQTLGLQSAWPAVYIYSVTTDSRA